MKKIVSLICCVSLVLSLLIPSAVLVNASYNQEEYFNVLDVEASGKGTDELTVSEEKEVAKLIEKSDDVQISKPIDIDAVESYFEVKDGEILISTELLKSKEFSDEEIAVILDSVKKANEKIESNVNLVVDSEDYSIVDESDDSATINATNVNKNVWYWWGVKLYRSYNETKKLVDKSNEILRIFGGISAGVSVIAKFAKATTADTIAMWGAVGAVIASKIVKDVNWVNENRSKYKGVVIDMPWWIAGYGINPQG